MIITIRNPSDPGHNKCTIQNIIQRYKDDPSINKNEEIFKNLAPFDFSKPIVEDMFNYKILKSYESFWSRLYPFKTYQVHF